MTIHLSPDGLRFEEDSWFVPNYAIIILFWKGEGSAEGGFCKKANVSWHLNV